MEAIDTVDGPQFIDIWYLNVARPLNVLYLIGWPDLNRREYFSAILPTKDDE
jgi:hypothetical protein